MSKSLGYAVDFKIVGRNPNILGKNVKRVWKCCKEYLLSINLTKSKALLIGGLRCVRINEFNFEIPTVTENFGLMVFSDPLWSAHTKEGASFTLKPCSLSSEIAHPTPSNKKNAYVSYVVPILSYGSSLLKPSKSDLFVRKGFQRKAVMWILNALSIGYQDMLIKLGIPYQEHVILLFAKILNGKVDINEKLRKNHRH